MDDLQDVSRVMVEGVKSTSDERRSFPQEVRARLKRKQPAQEDACEENLADDADTDETGPHQVDINI
jgi:hypothetical protein